MGKGKVRGRGSWGWINVKQSQLDHVRSPGYRSVMLEPARAEHGSMLEHTRLEGPPGLRGSSMLGSSLARALPARVPHYSTLATVTEPAPSKSISMATRHFTEVLIDNSFVFVSAFLWQ